MLWHSAAEKVPFKLHNPWILQMCYKSVCLHKCIMFSKEMRFLPSSREASSIQDTRNMRSNVFWLVGRIFAMATKDVPQRKASKRPVSPWHGTYLQSTLDTTVALFENIVCWWRVFSRSRRSEASCSPCSAWRTGPGWGRAAAGRCPWCAPRRPAARRSARAAPASSWPPRRCSLRTCSRPTVRFSKKCANGSKDD